MLHLCLIKCWSAFLSWFCCMVIPNVHDYWPYTRRCNSGVPASVFRLAITLDFDTEGHACCYGWYKLWAEPFCWSNHEALWSYGIPVCETWWNPFLRLGCHHYWFPCLLFTPNPVLTAYRHSYRLSSCRQVYIVFWWMQHFGGLTAKRHLGLSNSMTVGQLDFGKLCQRIRRRLCASNAKSAITYRSRSGKKAFKGSRFLKGTGLES